MGQSFASFIGRFGRLNRSKLPVESQPVPSRRQNRLSNRNLDGWKCEKPAPGANRGRVSVCLSLPIATPGRGSSCHYTGWGSLDHRQERPESHGPKSQFRSFRT